jgi:uncharacterized protein YdiU (UPF0061 family)
MHIPFDNSYARLPGRFYARLDPTPVAAPRLVRVNAGLAAQLGLDADELASAAGIAVLAGNLAPAGAEPMALAYAGHQFGHFVPQLGDGRANLLGEVVGCDGMRRDIQLKGSGPTPYSRRGDGRAALGPVLREYLISEAMAALGVPTTRALAVVMTGEKVWRETMMLPGAVLTRVAASHIRVGTFQYFAAKGDAEGVRLLADHAIARHFPEAASAANPYRALLDGVIAGKAELIAQWLLIGFIHGVMNTDNCAVSGETIDYGPCAFMDAYDPGAVFSSIDHYGRYAYGNQPKIAVWNLARLAECLVPLLGDEAAAQEALEGFAPRFHAAYLGGLRRKIGLSSEREGDNGLTQDLLRLMAADAADFTLTFRRLCDAAEAPEEIVPEGMTLGGLFKDGGAFRAWAERWRVRLKVEVEPAVLMRAVNPAVIARNHLVEAALTAAVERADFQPFEDLLGAVSRPFEDDAALVRYTVPPAEDQRVLQTFCGT